MERDRGLSCLTSEASGFCARETGGATWLGTLANWTIRGNTGVPGVLKQLLGVLTEDCDIGVLDAGTAGLCTRGWGVPFFSGFEGELWGLD